MFDRKTKDRFFNRIDLIPFHTCWEWSAGKNSAGYGAFYPKNKQILAHRYSYELHNGKIPDGHFVLHKCDNPSCVNPSHLIAGSQKDNLDDMDRKGRRYSGESHHSSKMNKHSVNELRVAANNGASVSDLSIKYGISQAQVYRIKNKELWR